MARILGLFPSALAAAAGGMSERAWEKEARALGLGARSSEMLSLWRVAKKIVTASPDEPFRDISEVPRGNDMSQWPSKNATGVVQNITLTYRDNATGAIKATYYRVTGSTAMQREQAMAKAIDAYSEHADRYGQTLIGAVHSSVYQLVPALVAE